MTAARSITLNTTAARRTVVLYSSDYTGYRLDGVTYTTANRCSTCWSPEGSLCSGRNGNLAHAHAGRVLVEVVETAEPREYLPEATAEVTGSGAYVPDEDEVDAIAARYGVPADALRAEGDRIMRERAAALDAMPTDDEPAGVEEPAATPIADALAVYETALGEHGQDYSTSTPTCSCGRTFRTRQAVGLHVSAAAKRAEREYAAATAAARAADPAGARAEVARLYEESLSGRVAAERVVEPESAEHEQALLALQDADGLDDPDDTETAAPGEWVVYCPTHAHYLVYAGVTGTTWTDEQGEARRYTRSAAQTAARRGTWLDHAPVAWPLPSAGPAVLDREASPVFVEPDQRTDDGLAHLLSDALLDACETAAFGVDRLVLLPSTRIDEVTCPRCLLLAVEEEVRRLGYRNVAHYLQGRDALRARVEVAADRPDSTDPIPAVVEPGTVDEVERANALSDTASGTDEDRATISARARELRPGDLVVDVLGNRQYAAYDVRLDDDADPTAVQVWTAVSDQERGLPPVLTLNARRELLVSRRVEPGAWEALIAGRA